MRKDLVKNHLRWSVPSRSLPQYKIKISVSLAYWKKWSCTNRALSSCTNCSLTQSTICLTPSVSPSPFTILSGSENRENLGRGVFEVADSKYENIFEVRWLGTKMKQVHFSICLYQISQVSQNIENAKYRFLRSLIPNTKIFRGPMAWNKNGTSPFFLSVRSPKSPKTLKTHNIGFLRSLIPNMKVFLGSDGLEQKWHKSIFQCLSIRSPKSPKTLKTHNIRFLRTLIPNMKIFLGSDSLKKMAQVHFSIPVYK